MKGLKLSAEFLAQYRNKQPKWGFGGLGYIVYLRTYSRKKADGTLERWDETVQRITEGNFRIEAKRLAEIGKLTDAKVAELTTEMERFYHLVFNLVMTPPGRGLWMSGTEYAERVGDAENNCFRSGTKVHTDKGVFNIEDLAGQTVNVLSMDGIYREAAFKSFGKQPLMKLTLANKDEIYTTPNHEWLVMSNGKVKQERVLTKDLKVSDRLPLVLPDKVMASSRGVAHGFVYGDGWINKTKERVEVKLFGEKSELEPLIKRFGRPMKSTYKGEDIPMYVDLPQQFKELPKDVTREYARGFIVGLIAADGSVRQDEVRIHNHDKVNIEKIRAIAMYAGYSCGNVYLDRDISPYDGTEKPLYCFNIRRFSIDSSELVISKQSNTLKPAAKEVTSTAVKSIEMTDLFEEVYCCVEMETHTMTVGSGVLTGQCWGVSMRPQPYFSGEPAKVSFAPVFTFDQAMKGGGVGVNVQRKYVNQIPKVDNSLELTFCCDVFHKDYESELESLGVIEDVVVEDYQYLAFKVHDSREGWAEALGKVIDAHYEGLTELVIDISDIRPRGTDIKGFGGVASGPAPLVTMLTKVNEILNRRVNDYVTPTEWGDVVQLIGTCVVAGNVRRTALILIGDQNDKEYVESKNYSLPQNLEASQWRWASNNSVDISVNTDRETLRNLSVNIYYNGEPGYVNVELSRNFGRIIDGFQADIDSEVEIFNPCGEITLPNASPCNLFEINLPRVHELISKEIEGEYLYEEVAYLAARYAYRITFRPYEWEATRDVVYRHRRLGVGITGITDWVLMKFGNKAILGFDDEGNALFNDEVTASLNQLYRFVKESNITQAADLNANPSIKVTTVKPSGTVSLLMGCSPGQHYHWAPYMIRRVRMSASAPLIPILEQCGYRIEPAVNGYNADGSYKYDFNTLVVEFPVKAPTSDRENFQSAGDVPLREQAALQALLATYWSDNAVSATLSFKKAQPKPVYFDDGTLLLDKFGKPELKIDKRDEDAVIEEITDILDRYKGVIKSTSLLPHATDTYPQMPYEEISEEKYNQMVARLTAKPWELIDGALNAEEDDTVDASQECVGGSCPIR